MSLAQPKDRWTFLLIATFIFALSTADRFLMSLFLEPIKTEFNLSDTAVGFLTGTIFGIVYFAASIPLGILADRRNRRNLLVIFVLIFGVMTSASGLVAGYFMLMLTRVGVAVGEAGCTPTPISLLADKFKPSRRAMAMTIFSIGSAIGGWLAASGGGYLSEAFGWRAAMIIFGLLSLPAALLLLFIQEPDRGALDGVVEASDEPASLRETVSFIISQKSVLHTILGGTILSFWGGGLVWWAPALLERSFGMTTGDAGELLGPVHGICGTLSIVAMAVVMRFLANHDPRRPLIFLTIMTALATLPSIGLVLNRSLSVEVGLLWAFLPVVYAYAGPTFAVISSGVPAKMRGQAIAYYVAMVNLVLLALAPQFVGCPPSAPMAQI